MIDSSELDMLQKNPLDKRLSFEKKKIDYAVKQDVGEYRSRWAPRGSQSCKTNVNTPFTVYIGGTLDGPSFYPSKRDKGLHNSMIDSSELDMSTNKLVDKRLSFFEKKKIDCAVKQDVRESRSRSTSRGSQSCKTKENTPFAVCGTGTFDGPSFHPSKRDKVSGLYNSMINSSELDMSTNKLVDKRLFFFEKKKIDCAVKQDVREFRIRSASRGSQTCKTKENTPFTVCGAGTLDGPSFHPSKRDKGLHNSMIDSSELDMLTNKLVDRRLSFFEKKKIDCSVKQDVGESRIRSAPRGSQTCKTKENAPFTVYRAGTLDGPSFHPSKRDKVWLVTNPALYYPLGKNQMVCLWKTVIQNTPDILAEWHLKYEGVCVVELTENAKHTYQLHQILKSKMTWELCEVPSSERGGMSVIDFATLVQAIIDYMRDNRPSTPEEFNFQAELKAASHWRWFDETVAKFERGPHHDIRIVKAAKISLKKWIDDVNKIKKKLLEEWLSPAITKKYESDLEHLEEDIFNLIMYDDIYKIESHPTE